MGDASVELVITSVEDAQKLLLFQALTQDQGHHLLVANEKLPGVAKGMRLTAFQRQPIPSGIGVEQLKASMNVALPHVLTFTAFTDVTTVEAVAVVPVVQHLGPTGANANHETPMGVDCCGCCIAPSHMALEGLSIWALLSMIFHEPTGASDTENASAKFNLILFGALPCLCGFVGVSLALARKLAPVF